MTIPPSTPGWTFANINSKVRAITGTPSTDQLSDAQINSYIINYQLYVMPHELKVQIDNQNLLFKTVPGQDIYPFPAAFLTNSPGAYADGFPLIFYEDPDIFYQDWPLQYAVNNIATGTGVPTTYTAGLQNPPIIMGSAFVTDGTQVVQDNGLGAFTGDGTGTINYITGAISVTFTAVSPVTATIYAKYRGYQGNRPQGVLWFNNQFQLMPVPDQVYQIQMQGFVAPTAIGPANSTPPITTNPLVQPEWGPLLAYGAALEIFSDRGDVANYDKYYPMLKRYETIALARTIQEYSPMQSVPRF